jgi:hypothetical protein
MKRSASTSSALGSGSSSVGADSNTGAGAAYRGELNLLDLQEGYGMGMAASKVRSQPQIRLG